MIVRAIPNGDERDKDVANAIRYAVDEGADIINMSFGKAFSPRKSLVDAAVRYADEHGVLMIHAAGNDSDDIDVVPSFPTKKYDGGGEATNWVEVGAANWDVASLAATFSNYGQETGRPLRARRRHPLDGPGQRVRAERRHEHGGTRRHRCGRAPDGLLPRPDGRRREADPAGHGRAVRRPGRADSRTGRRVPFGTLSVTGGVVNAYEAVKAAQAR